MNIRQKTLAALLVLGIGMSGCNTNDNNLPSQIVNKNTDENKTEGNRTVPTSPGENNESNVTDPNPPDEVIIPVPPKQNLEALGLNALLEKIGNEHNNGESNIAIADLEILKSAGIVNINYNYVNIYRSYIESNDTTFSSPATVAQVQSMIDEVNALNLPEHPILDRSFFKKTNGVFEHRFVYLPIESNTTGRTWLNNNLGAEYANVDSSAYNPSQQATASNDHLAYGSLFQWGRKADGHELMDWTGATTGTGRYGTTTTKADNPSDSLFIIMITYEVEWRVNKDDTLWASESSANNVCPAGYRLPLNPNEADDGEHELAVEVHSWDLENADGAMSSDLKMPLASGGISGIGGDLDKPGTLGSYWGGSVMLYQTSDGIDSYPHYIYFHKDRMDLSTVGRKSDGMSVRCIKD